MSDVFPEYKTISVSSLVEYARNSRTHSAEQVDKIAASIREFGFTNPVLTDGQNGIIAGHGRVMAAKKLGLTEVPAIELSDMPASYKKNGVKDCTCQDCKTEFSVRKDTNPKVCTRCASARGGRAIAGKFRSARKGCEACGKEFRASLGYRFCSVECRHDALREDRECKNCGDSFKVLKSASGNSLQNNGDTECNHLNSGRLVS